MTVELTKEMILAIQVAFAEFQTGEWTAYVTEEQEQQVQEGQSALEQIFRDNNVE